MLFIKSVGYYCLKLKSATYITKFNSKLKGRRTRAGQSRVVPQENNADCGSRAPLMECMKILNILAKDLHEEAKCIRSEICEIHDSFGAESNGQSEARHQLIELSKYVRILEYRLKQVKQIEPNSHV